MRHFPRRDLLFLLLTLVVLQIACGGGGSSGGPPPPPPPPPPPTLRISHSTQLPNGIPGMPYSATLQATGGTGALTWSAGSPYGLPSWLNLDSSTGVLSGTPLGAQDIYISVQITDSGSPRQISSADFRVLILATLEINANVSSGNRGMPYFSSITVRGGVPGYTLSVASGSLPPGLTLSSDGMAISGTPAQGGTFAFTIQATDSGTPQQTATTDVVLEIQTLLRINTIPNIVGVRGRNYTASFGAINGTPPLVWSAQNLPAGLSIDAASGVVTGIPSQPSGGSSQISVTDSSVPAQSDSVYWYPSIADNIQILSTYLGKAIINQAQTMPISYSGGIFPISARLVSGTPPAGFQISQTFVTVTATQLGHYSFDLMLSDSASPPQTAQATFEMDVVPIPPIIRSVEVPRAIVGRNYSLALAGQYGTPPYSWSISAGSLPDGLSLDSQGLIAGIPTTAGSSTFVVRLTDSGAPAQTAWTTIYIQVLAHALGRNDTIANATPISNGTIFASISPFSDPSSSGPDGDYYRLTANGGSTVSVSVFARRISNSTLDSVVEIVDASGTRFATCNDPVQPYLRAPAVLDPNPNDFNNPCINDDDPANGTTDSDLQFQVPGTPGVPTTFYIHVIDFRGDARPDMTYQLLVTGAN